MRLRSVSLLVALPLAARPPAPPGAAAIRTTYLLHSCVAGAPATAAGSADPAGSAWRVLCAVQANHASGVHLAALLARTDTLVSARPADPWVWLAHVGALMQVPGRSADVPAAVDTLWAHARGHADVEGDVALLLADQALQVPYARADTLTHVVTLLDHHTVIAPASARLAWMTLRAEALARLAAQRADSARIQADSLTRAATAAFAEARAIDPKSPLPDFRAGLAALAAYDANPHGAPAPLVDGFQLLQHTVTLAPDALGAHEALWQAGKTLAFQQRHMPAQRKPVLDGVAHDFAAVEARHPQDPAVLAAVAEYACNDDLEQTPRCTRLREAVLRDFPTSDAAEAVLYYDWKALSDSATLKYKYTITPLRGARRATYLAAAHAYLARAPHVNDRQFTDFAYWYSTALYGDTSVATADLLAMLQGLEALAARPGSGEIDYEVSPALRRTILLLADRGVGLGDATRAAHLAIDQCWRVAAHLVAGSAPNLADSVRNLLTNDVAGLYDALGWALAAQGNQSDGERAITLATILAPSAGPTAGARALSHATPWFHLGELALRRGDTAAATHNYVLALANEAMDMDWILPHPEAAVATLPAEERLRTLYAATHHGDTTGMADFLAGDTLSSRATLLATRIADPKPLPAFRLVTLDGHTVTSDTLRGKVVVINGWGTWCGWCVAELPDYQQLYEHYKADPNVLLLTIDREVDSTLTADSVRAFMTKRNWTFPVLLEANKYLDSASVNGFPSTVFVDRQGRVAFRKDGYSKYLGREFAWRIEALKRDLAGPTTSAAAGPAGR